MDQMELSDELWHPDEQAIIDRFLDLSSHRQEQLAAYLSSLTLFPHKDLSSVCSPLKNEEDDPFPVCESDPMDSSSTEEDTLSDDLQCRSPLTDEDSLFFLDPLAPLVGRLPVEYLSLEPGDSLVPLLPDTPPFPIHSSPVSTTSSNAPTPPPLSLEPAPALPLVNRSKSKGGRGKRKVPPKDTKKKRRRKKQRTIQAPPVKMQEPTARIGKYTPQERAAAIKRYRDKIPMRNFVKKITHQCRSTFAKRRPRKDGRFISLHSESESN